MNSPLTRYRMPAGARLKAALPGLVEEHILGDPADHVLVAAPAQGGRTRPVAMVQRDWLESLVRVLLAQGARAVAALPVIFDIQRQTGRIDLLAQARALGYHHSWH